MTCDPTRLTRRLRLRPTRAGSSTTNKCSIPRQAPHHPLLGHTGVVTLIHFTAAWAEAICGPHRVEVAGAAGDELGLTVTECDVDTGPRK